MDNPAITKAVNGEGVALVLVDCNNQLISFFPYDYEQDEMTNGQQLTQNMLFQLAQWLSENRYMPTSDNKRMLVPEDSV